MSFPCSMYGDRPCNASQPSAAQNSSTGSWLKQPSLHHSVPKLHAGTPSCSVQLRSPFFKDRVFSPPPPTTTAPEMDHQRIFRYTAPGSPSLITQTLILYHRGTGPLSHTTPPITQPPLSQLGREVLTKSQRQN